MHYCSFLDHEIRTALLIRLHILKSDWQSSKQFDRGALLRIDDTSLVADHKKVGNDERVCIRSHLVQGEHQEQDDGVEFIAPQLDLWIIRIQLVYKRVEFFSREGLILGHGVFCKIFRGLSYLESRWNWEEKKSVTAEPFKWCLDRL
jgi:hypothetical protein